MRSWVCMVTLLMLGACSSSLGEVVVVSERDAGPHSESSEGVADDEAAATNASAESSESAADADGPMGAMSGGSGLNPAGMSNGPGAAMEACGMEGAMRCAATGEGLREVCTGGIWGPGEACASGQVCNEGEQDGAPTCLQLAEICIGRGGQQVCDGAGVMYTCSALGVIESMTPCSTARHCQLGLAQGTCAMCLRGNLDEYKCEGTDLLRCSAAGDGYEVAKVCESESLCNTVAGDCTTAACMAGQFVCDGDVLKQCKQDLTGLEEVKPCGPGLCDAEAGMCDACVPGATSCEASTAVTCNAEGSAEDRSPCAGNTPVCAGGMCLQCGTKADCGEPEPCEDLSCVGGACMSSPRVSGSCTASFGNGFCVAGMCRQCRAPSDCGSSTDPCKVWACNNYTCELEDKPGDYSSDPNNCGTCGNSCSSLFSPGPVCANGACVQCTNPADCDSPPDSCQENKCTSNRCVLERKPGTRDDPNNCGGCGIKCPGNKPFCDGSTCVECRNGTKDCDAVGKTSYKCEQNRCARVSCELDKGGVSDGNWCCHSSCKITATTIQREQDQRLDTRFEPVDSSIGKPLCNGARCATLGGGSANCCYGSSDPSHLTEWCRDQGAPCRIAP